MIRTKDFLYVRHFFPEKVKYKAVGYRANNVPMMPELLQMRDAGQLNTAQQSWFETKMQEELFAVKEDPHNLHNLTNEPRYRDTLNTMRRYLRDYLQTTPDLGQMPESQLINLMWPDSNQPLTSSPEITVRDGKIHISCATPGASIAYFFSNSPVLTVDIFKIKTHLYSKAIPIQQKKYVFAIAERIGYQMSATKYLSLEK